MSEPATNEEYQKLADSAAEELNRIHGGNREYLTWLDMFAPFWLRVTAYTGIEVGRGVGILPLPVFKTLLDVMVNLHRHGHAMWQERDWFETFSAEASADGEMGHEPDSTK